MTVTVSDRCGDELYADTFRRDVLPLTGSLLRDAKRLTRSHADAEDLLQETLMHAYAGFHGFQPGTNLRAWLRRIMRNRWISEYRRMERRPAEVLAEDVSTRISGPSTHMAFLQPSAEDHVLAALPHSELATAMAVLSRDNRLVLYYADVEGYPLREVARLMNIPVGTVMSRLHRGRRRLRAELTTQRLAAAPEGGPHAG
ncbi:sigma-70 family RNA polymerase sigma factor [Mycobacterium sp. 21AC1]|uniref:sigma-70 family RNA polymerase sigma factor n=1 Tax=[Mycobacterium] appelbergii TaxID=2939269 RepID=UPI002939467B|nr:sigma-70 family RNA polymerase sigma factor [Mycobacterium sp. 21AC1]MDV3125992.1 sigma-70 family RNA polymerase sigma factor [Mycobacterium sp. 21AC1]